LLSAGIAVHYRENDKNTHIPVTQIVTKL
jgi:hypothetical protein